MTARPANGKVWSPKSNRHGRVYALILERNEGRCNFCDREIKEMGHFTRRFGRMAKYYHSMCALAGNHLTGGS